VTIPDRNTWRELLRPALRILDSLAAGSYGPLEATLGGGTVLMLRFDHRISKDIDLFFYDAQALTYLSPRLNDVSASYTNNYEEQANALKLNLPAGDIDFIVAAPVIPGCPVESVAFESRTILLDATAEILAKKLFYRADSFKARDAFDMAVVLEHDPAAAHAALRATKPRHPTLLARLQVMRASNSEEVARAVLPTESGRPFIPGMIDRLAAAIIGLEGR
jgi:hypothetical protein